MSSTDLIERLLRAGLAEDCESIARLSGAGIHAQVLRFSDSLRGARLDAIAQLPQAECLAFAKALAIYENTVGGLGSVTALQRVLPLLQDRNHAVLDWILSNTRSYWYYSHNAKSFAELEVIEAARAARRALNEQREREREATAKSHRAEKASANLFNAIRRGDSKAVEALLRQGARAEGVTPDGVPLAQYAENLGRPDIAVLLRHTEGNNSTA